MKKKDYTDIKNLLTWGINKYNSTHKTPIRYNECVSVLREIIKTTEPEYDINRCTERISGNVYIVK